MLIAHCVAKGLNIFPAYLVKEFIVALIDSVLCMCICHKGQVSRPRGWMVAVWRIPIKKKISYLCIVYTQEILIIITILLLLPLPTVSLMVGASRLICVVAECVAHR